MKMVHLTLILIVTWTAYVVNATSSEDIRRSLETEILQHTLHYLRRKVLDCLRQAGTSRTKRKVNVGQRPDLEYELDMDVLLQTRQYLVSRLIACRQLTGDADSQDLAIDRHTEHDRKDFWFDQRQEQEVKSEMRLEVDIATTEESVLLTTASPTFQIFELGLKNVSCGSVELLKDGMVFRCRNLWVDSVHRLPNMHLCPPMYHPDDWTSSHSVHSRTRNVLDISGLCDAFTRLADPRLYALSARVVWDCDKQAVERVKWLHDKWSGTVLDNGYLRDLECTFNGVFPLPLDV